VPKFQGLRLGDAFRGKLFRENCFQTPKGYHIKDLRTIEDIDLSRTLIVDNSASSFGAQLTNGVPVVPYFFREDDIELIKLRNFLIEVHSLINEGCDVRVLMEKYFRFPEYLKSDGIEDLKKALLGAN